MKHWYTILSQNLGVLTESGDHQRVQNVLVLQNDYELLRFCMLFSNKGYLLNFPVPKGKAVIYNLT